MHGNVTTATNMETVKCKHCGTGSPELSSFVSATPPPSLCCSSLISSFSGKWRAHR